ncbi:MAG: sigma-70 family RNA polymerase sigma factor [Opitutaceae bacterium]|nr:sigma-70 family RNA polymerase sigma factor [Opitutaceae bacterium]
MAQRAEFHRFLAAQLGSDADAEDVLKQSLLKALQNGGNLRRGERAVAWFNRILRNAISDHSREKGTESRRAEKFLADLQGLAEDVAALPANWDAAVCACFRGLLPTLRPRYAEVIRRVDLRGEAKQEVCRDLGISRATMDVLLHRARTVLRRRLAVFCGACTREKSVESFRTNQGV